MYSVKNFLSNDDVVTIGKKGCFTALEYTKDLSVSPKNAIQAYFCSKINIRKRQLVCDLKISPVTVQAGAMQWSVGDVNATTGIKGVGDLFGKAIKGAVSDETMIKPEYKGTGILVLEPTYKHLVMLNVEEWGSQVVLDDGLFLACEASLKHTIVARKTISSIVAGGEGLFNLSLQGNGVVCLESPVPQEELIEVDLEKDVLRVDGNLAIAWSNTLKFTIERSGKSLMGSAASGEGLVNVYRGTGKVLIAPIDSPTYTSVVTKSSK